ncbi:hypothetical protein PTKIN_Ptkin14bG0231100 [Pterospermum kingtungense]
MEENVESRQSGSESEVRDIEFDPKQIDDIVGYDEKRLESVNHCSAFPTNPEQRCIRPAFNAQFLKRIKKKASIKDLVYLILNDLRRVKDYYDSDCIDEHLQSDRDFIDRILRDAAFVIELFLRDYKKEITRDENDFFEKWKNHVIQKDLMYISNQLPFFILKDIYDRAFATADDFVAPDFIHLTCHFFRRTEYRLKADKEQGEYLYSAALLREAGVKFKVDASRTLCDVTFNERIGELIIPTLVIDDSTEKFFLNLMTWEQMHYYPHEIYVCNYVFLMAYLMRSAEDVDLLIRRGYIINQLRSNKAVVSLFNNLRLHSGIKVEKNHFSVLFWKINAYNAIPRHGWMATLRLQYFSNPWSSLATVAAVILLPLTLIQTICSVISVA